MEYGILMVLCGDNAYQIIGAVSSKDEALEMAASYDRSWKYGSVDVFPAKFEIHRRDERGRYTTVEKFML